VTRSLWFRVLRGSVVGVVLVQAAAGLAIYLLMRSRLYAEFDASLAGKARALAALVEQEGGEVEVDEFHEPSLVEFATRNQPEYLQVWLAEGDVLFRSSSLDDGDLERVRGRLDAPAFRSVALPDGRPGRLAGVTFIPRQKHTVLGPPRTVTLVLARATTGVDHTLARLRLLLIAVCAGAAFVAAALLDWVVSRGLRPASDLASQIAGLRDAGLAARVALDDAPAELTPVVERLNALLAQLDAAFGRERAFTANVAHELRTPLTGLLTTLDLALSRERKPAEYRDALTRCHAICSQMRVMVDNLLSLARADAGQVTIRRQAVDIEQVLEESWLPLAQQADDRGLHVEWHLDGVPAIATDPEVLRLILLNVLSNAVGYADTGGHVRIASSRRHGRVEAVVANTGSTLSDAEAQHVFERFWQADAARSTTGVHCGLGLALCRTLTSLLGGTIAVAAEAGGEFTVALTFEEPQGNS